MWSGGVFLECLLVIAGLHQHVSAARTWQQRRELQDPYLVLPPGLPTGGQGRHVPVALGEKEFTLRHIYHHGSHKYPDLHRYLDVTPETQFRITDDDGQTIEQAPRSLRAKVASSAIQRLVNRKKSNVDGLLNHARTHGEAAFLPSSAWTIEEVAGPNVTDKETVLSFAEMSSNAYEPVVGEGHWMDVGPRWNQSAKFGWESDGLRGHIFADKTNSTIVIAIKGTSVAVFYDSETSFRDKENDNLFGSCCCGQGGQYLWEKPCSCMTSAYTCNNTCVVKELHKKDRYYLSARELYHNVTERYPGADIWLTGHSLGGVVSALLALTYGNPTVTYEAYPDALAAKRLGLPVPPGYRVGSHNSRTDTGIYHVGHTADPIYMGICNGASSFCTIGGYAFEGVCHTGHTCRYDTVKDKGWRVSAATHRIHDVIRDVIKAFPDGPTCDEDLGCRDCYNWKFFESNGTETTTSATHTSTSTSSRTRTRTETCKTPGWWGCLDETTTTTTTTTSTTSSTSSTSSTSTTTCKTPGWFGCKDSTTTTSSSNTITVPSTVLATPTSTASSSSTTCQTPGWFGCNDVTTTTSATPKPSGTRASSTASQTSATSCTSADWFGLVCVDPSPTVVPVEQFTASSPPADEPKCKARYWYGACKTWQPGLVYHQNDL